MISFSAPTGYGRTSCRHGCTSLNELFHERAAVNNVADERNSLAISSAHVTNAALTRGSPVCDLFQLYGHGAFVLIGLATGE
jgi:hypothetical protein